MKLEVLLATINQLNDTVLDDMKLNSDVIVCNQNDEKTDYRRYIKNGYQVRWYDFQEQGVGLNRNNALLRSTADICLLSDDDVIYEGDYREVVLAAFEKLTKADVILFNIYSTDGTRREKSKKIVRINRFNCGRYGTVRIAFRRMSVIKHASSFNQLFGGGCMFTAGEDTMFIRECIRKGLRVFAVPECILRLADARPSTWFEGYNQKFFEDFGSSYYCHYGKIAPIIAFVQLIRKRKVWLRDSPFFKSWKCAIDGINKYKQLR